MSPDGPDIQTAPAPERVERDVTLPASPGEVWEVITADGWLAEEVGLDLEPNGEAWFVDGDSVRTGWVEEACPPGAERSGWLIFWWGPEGAPATRVSLTLEPAPDGGTRLRVAETRPFERVELVGVPLPGQRGGTRGPAMLALV